MDGWMDRGSGRELAKRLAGSVVLGSKRPDSTTVHPVVPVCIQLHSDRCHYNEVIEPYNQLDAAYKETLKHTIISHNIMK